MKSTQRHSYGVLPVWKTDEELKFLVVNQVGTDKNPNEEHNHWTFAKGTPENDESPRETAIRETKEEVGLSFENIIEDPSFTVSYTFIEKDEPVDKQVTYFLGFPQSLEFEIDKKEILEAQWLTYEEAKEKLLYEEIKDLLDNVVLFLKTFDK